MNAKYNYMLNIIIRRFRSLKKKYTKKSSLAMAGASHVQNLLPQNVGSITNYLQ